MKRLVFLLTALTALGFASSASAYVEQSQFDTAAGSGTVGGNTFEFDVSRDVFGTNPPIGTITVSGTDANGTHSFRGFATCLQVDPTGTNAGMLFVISRASGNPATLFAVLVHVRDLESADSENGVNDRIDFTNLNQKQYNRQLALGCPPSASPRAAITSGNITVVRGVPIIVT
jgi:hypothetical protein